MEGKLIKRDKHYFFWSSDWNPDKKEGFVANTTNLLPTKLSIKNCQAIENGYDLDELAEESVNEVKEEHADFTFKEIYKSFFKEGFQKALEILGDKKFSEEDVMQAIITTQVSDSIKNNDDRLELIQSLQQTEWYCTFNPDEKDSEGCLILKRKI